MRILLSRHGANGDDEAGAVAIMVALSTLLMSVLAAFAVDLGSAYNSKRQLQTAADSAALAAAAVYANYTGTCASLAANPAYRMEANAAADDYSLRNELDFADFEDGSLAAPTCNGDGELEVTYAVAGSTPAVFGGLTGSGPTITTSQSASAVVDVPTTAASAVRPLALCSTQFPSNWQAGGVVRLDFPGPTGWTAPPSCPVPSGPAGNWWTVDCPEERIGGTGQPGNGLEDLILNGCEEPLTIIPGQSSVANPSGLSSLLRSECPDAPIHSETCLSGDPGQLDAGHMEDSWRALMERGTEAIFPVFCGQPVCSGATMSESGTNAVFPLHALAAMRICGFHFNKTPDSNRGAISTGACSSLPIDPLTDDSRDNYLLVKLANVLTSGTTRSTNCALGTTCDTGLRRVHLSQ